MTTGLNMNQFPKDAASPRSSPSMEDQESGRNVLPRNRDCSMLKDFILGRCSPQGTKFNTARMVLAEAVGTFILMYCISAIVSMTRLLKGEVGLMGYAATAGMTIVIIIFSLGPISDAHVNPAITLAFAIYGHFPWSRVPLYIIAQLIGSVLATYVGASVYGVESSLMITRPLRGPASAFWVEFLATFIMVFLIAGLSYNHQSVGQLSGFVIGIGIGLAVVITGPVSGASMNPARSIGPAILSWDFESIWIYITAPVTGAIAGAFLYRLLRLQGQESSSTASSPNASLLIYSQEALS